MEVWPIILGLWYRKKPHSSREQSHGADTHVHGRGMRELGLVSIRNRPPNARRER